MKAVKAVSVLAAATLTTATNLFVSSYAGTITTLSLAETLGNYTLTPIASSTGCAPNASWLTLDYSNGHLYCLDEGLTVPNGSLSSFDIEADGSLTLVQKASTISGPVSGVIYGPQSGEKAIALAHYTGSALSSWTLNSSASADEAGGFAFNQNILFTLQHPGPNPSRQEAPHEHEAILDPTGQYILVPDLGADLVRIFSFASDSNSTDTDKLTALTPLSVVPGSGPRHAVFYNPYGVACENCTTFLYVVTELANTVTAYAVTYLADGAGLSFKEAFTTSVYGPKALPVGNAAAEIEIDASNQYLIISNRNNTSFSLPNPDPNNSTAVPSDSLSTFRLSTNGTLDFMQLAPAGGSYPRQFSLNAAGNLVAVGLQYSSEVVILARDVATGLIGDEVARVCIDGQITCVVWNE